ncbi:MAG: beta-propeller fold lactonase family protein [Betaproteobacteria bacterium]|nr:beta-propeller fold lactonase family protein [Betaproteobacteria bacterium]
MPTLVYVSNGQDGDIGSYLMRTDGTLEPLARIMAAGAVGPLAVSPDRRILYAACRTQPYSVRAYTIDRATGTLTFLAASPLVESFPYIALDRTGRFLLGASYSAHLVSVNAIEGDGRVAAAPLQVLPVGRNAHSIRVDESNRFVFVPALGTDQVFQFTFDAQTGRLSSNTPAIAPVTPGTGPRHFVTSRDNRFVYVLSELLATVTTFALDGKTGLLTEVGVASGLPPDTLLVPGKPGGPIPRTERDIWAADIHLAPNGRFIYISERTTSTIGVLSVDGTSGRLAYASTTATERQPRGFAIDPTGRFMVVSGEKSETISVHVLDPATGEPRFLARYPGGRGASWVEIVGLD